jgi:hypothetical protein
MPLLRATFQALRAAPACPGDGIYRLLKLRPACRKLNRLAALDQPRDRPSNDAGIALGHTRRPPPETVDNQ